MKVKELIEKLQELPNDADIYYLNSEFNAACDIEQIMYRDLRKTNIDKSRGWIIV